MFDISAKFVAEQDEISGLETIGWEKHSWKYLFLIGDERIINFQRTKVYVFSDSVLCFGKLSQNPESNEAWKQRLGWIKSSHSYRNFHRIDGEANGMERVEYFPRFKTLQLSEEVKHLLFRLGEAPEIFTGRISIMSMFDDISCGTKDNEKECLANAKFASLYARKFGTGHWSYLCMQESLVQDTGHSLVLVPKRSGAVSVRTVHKESGTKLQKGCCWNLLRVDVQFSMQQLHCPGVNLEAKDMENCRFTLQPFRNRLRLFFA